MTSLYVYAGILIAVLFLAWRLVAAFNAPKVEAENTAQAKEDTAQKEVQKQEQKQRQEHREVVIDKRNEERDKRRGWRFWRRRGGEPEPTNPNNSDNKPVPVEVPK